MPLVPEVGRVSLPLGKQHVPALATLRLATRQAELCQLWATMCFNKDAAVTGLAAG